MPFTSVQQAPDNWRVIGKVPLDLNQVNFISNVFDGLKAKGIPDSEAAAIALGQFRKTFTKGENSWMRKNEQINKQNTFKLNVSAAVTKQHEGRDFLVVPVVAVREMALRGVDGYNNGAEFLPAEEIEKSAENWENIAVTYNHTNESAKKRSVIEAHGVGFFWNVRYNSQEKSLEGEIWIDKSKALSKPIVDKINAGEDLEVSTGYKAASYRKNGTDSEGREYNAVQVNVVPDQLAVFTEGSGACSISDGCGIKQNESDEKGFEKIKAWLAEQIQNLKTNKEDSSMKLTDKKRAGLIAGLMKANSELKKEDLEKLNCDDLANKALEVMTFDTKSNKELDKKPDEKKLDVSKLNAETAEFITNAVNEATEPMKKIIEGYETKENEKADKIKANLVKNHGFKEDEFEGMTIDVLKRLEKKLTANYAGQSAPLAYTINEETGLKANKDGKVAMPVAEAEAK